MVTHHGTLRPERAIGVPGVTARDDRRAPPTPIREEPP